MARFRSIVLAAIVLTLGTNAAQAELRSWVCEFPPTANVLLPSQIEVRYDPVSWNTVVVDSVIKEYVGSPAKADVTELRNGTVIYDWRVQGVPRTLLYSSVLSYSLKIDPTGKSYLEGTASSGLVQRVAMRGRCS